MITINELTPQDAVAEILAAQDLFRVMMDRRRPARAMTGLQRFLLMALDRRGPLPMSELVNLLEVGPTTASQFVKALEEHGWVTRSFDVVDRRRHLVTITAAGKIMVDEAQRRERARLERIVTALTPEERAQLVHLVHRVASILSETSDFFRSGRPDG